MTGPTDRLLAAMSAGLLGLVIGSFLNVVVYRLPLGMSVVHPRSRCPACGTQLAGIDNVPVLSWVALRGRCRHCASPVSARYPVVELVTGLLFAGTAAALAGEAPLAPLVLVEASLIAAAAIDLDHSPIPLAVVSGGLLGAVSLGAVTAGTGDPSRLGWAAVTASVATLLWATVEIVARRAVAVHAGATSPGDVRQPAEDGVLGRLLLVASTAATAGWLWPVGGWVVAAGAAGSVAIVATRPHARPPLLIVALLFGIVAVAGAAAGGA